jgi:hypothetical protein
MQTIMLVWVITGVIMIFSESRMRAYLKKEKIDYPSKFRGAAVKAYYKETKRRGKIGVWYKVVLAGVTVMAIDSLLLAVYQIFYTGGLSLKTVGRENIFNWEDWLRFLKR